MKNKLLLSSALLGTLVIGSSAYAQTTVSGSVAMGYKSLSGYQTAAGTTASQHGFGRESQLNVQNKGKLANGMNYAAGFSFEVDGGQATDISNENVYIDLILGNTILTVSEDHIQNTNRTRGNIVGETARSLASGNAVGTAIFQNTPGANTAQAMGVGITQVVPNIGSFSALYAPSNKGGTDDNVESAIEDNNESAYEIGFVGDFGVKGLSAHAFINEEKRVTGETRAHKGYNYGVSYTVGQVTVGYNYKEDKAGGGTTNTEQDELGVAFAVTPALSIGANYTKADRNVAAGVDAKSKSIAVGYNLGPVVVTGQYAQMEAVTGTAATGDVDIFYLKAVANF